MAKKRRGAVGRPRKPNTGNKSGSRLASVSKRVVNSAHKKSQSRKSISSNKLVPNNISVSPKCDQVVLPTVVQLCPDDPVVTSSTNGNSTISKTENCSDGSSEKALICQPPITKTTSQLLRNMLLSTDRRRAKSATSSSTVFSSNISSSVPVSTPVNNPPYYYDYYQQYENGPLNLEVMTPRKSSKGKCWNSRKSNGNSVSLSKSPANVNRGNFYTSADLHAFPDIPQLADVDVAASLRGQRDCILNDQLSVDDDVTSNTQITYIEDQEVETSATEDTLSNQSTTDSEHRDFDQRWATMMSSSTARSVFDENSGGVGENTIMMTPSCCGDTSTLDSDDRLVVDESLFLNNDLMHIQNYISDTVDATTEDAIIPLPDTTDVICTLQYYESRLLADHHLQNINEENLSTIDNSNENEQQLHHHHHTLAEFASMLPCPVAGCLWYSHSATLYVHLFTCHQEMISYGSTITHAFRRQDVRDYCFYTHLQYVQNTVYIVTVAYDCYSRTFVVTIQHVSSYGDNTSVSPTTATLIAGGINNVPPSGLSYNSTRQQHNHHDQQSHSWTGHVQPYTVPLDVLHADGRCLFIDPVSSTVSDHVIVGVHLSNSVMPYEPETIPTSSMLACL